MVQVQLYNVGCSDAIDDAANNIVAISKQSDAWKGMAVTCLNTMGKNIRRKDGSSGSEIVLRRINQSAAQTDMGSMANEAKQAAQAASGGGGGGASKNCEPSIWNLWGLLC